MIHGRHRARSTRWLVLMLSAFAHVACAYGNYAEDEAISKTVIHDLIHEEKVNLTRVDVHTNQGTVYLTGEVQNHEQKKRAEQIARKVQGVQRVVNKLELQP